MNAMHELFPSGQVIDLSIAVMAPRAMAARHPDLVEGTQIWTGPLSSEGVATAVDQALTASHAPGTR